MQVGSDIEAAKKAIESLKETLKTAKEKQGVARAEIKKLEKDMSEFKNNKEGKIEELRVSEFLPSKFLATDCAQANISKQKSAIQKHNVVMKTQQKETQTATVELGKLLIPFCRDFAYEGAEQLEADLAAADQAVVEIKATADAMRQELQDQYKQRDTTTVRSLRYSVGSPGTDFLTH